MEKIKIKKQYNLQYEILKASLKYGILENNKYFIIDDNSNLYFYDFDIVELLENFYKNHNEKTEKEIFKKLNNYINILNCLDYEINKNIIDIL